MDHAEFNSTMVPTSTPSQGLGSTPNPVLPLIQDYPTLSQTNSTNKRQRHDSDDEINTATFFKPQENFPKFLIIKSENQEKPITTLSPFVIEKQIEAAIGTPKTVKKLKNGTLLVETTRKIQTENLLKMKTFFNLPVTVSEHKTLNTSKGIIRDRTLKGESEENIAEYLKNQGVIAVKRFTIKKGHSYIETNTLLLTFNMITVPKNLRIFYRFVPVDVYIPNPLRCFNCQRFGHHELNCPEDIGSVCENCGMGNHDHLTSRCKNPPQCVNCGQNHVSKSNECVIWKKEKEIMKIKVTKNLTYLEARSLYETQPEVTYSKIIQSAQITKPETKDKGSQTDEKDTLITPSSKIITPRKQKTTSTSTQPKATSSNAKPISSTSSQGKPNKSQSAEKSSRESRSMSKSRPRNRSNSKSPRASQKKEKPVRITRVQDESIKLTNTYNGLEEMEEDPPQKTQ